MSGCVTRVNTYSAFWASWLLCTGATPASKAHHLRSPFADVSWQISGEKNKHSRLT